MVICYVRNAWQKISPNLENFLNAISTFKRYEDVLTSLLFLVSHVVPFYFTLILRPNSNGDTETVTSLPFDCRFCVYT